MIEAITVFGDDVALVAALLGVIAAISLAISRSITLTGLRMPRIEIPSPRRLLPELPTFARPDLSFARLNWRSILPVRRRAAMEAIAAGALGLDEQWMRLSNAISSRIDRMDQASTLQQRAAVQIEAAGYALERMLDELGTVMTISRPVVEVPLRAIETRSSHRAAPTQLAA